MCVRISLVAMSVDSAEGVHIHSFFTNLQKQFIGVCALFATRGENFENFSEQSKRYILENLEALQRIILWIHNPSIDIELERTSLVAFCIGLAEQSVLRNLRNRIQLHIGEDRQATIGWHGERRQIQR